ncbi:MULTISPECIES: acyltransferase family protein [Nostoc]|uniref:Acyltransferase n=2 Tax=Nostoc TaxID=1177 RepID=A0ABR8I4B6_9NOSO|nr:MULTISPECIES: acyltransferase [Nostoc]MBD2559221.1 acyltransferase [Nostoc linckia FACHB-391]MBD2646235.1 acyltransferase [Nostoc foliaceum FACHB-393]
MLVEETQRQPIYNIPSIRNYQWSTHLDLLRGLASLLVFIGHMRLLLFVEYSEISNPNFLIKRLNSLTGLGHQAVMIFFVLSGFFISASVLRTIQQNKWSWINYIITRLTRLYIVLIPALLLSSFWDFLGIKIFGTGQDSFYGEKFHNGHLATYKILENLTLQNFLGTIAFLQTIFVDLFGSNKAVWSLAYEFWYYILFPSIILFFCVKSLKLRIFYVGLTSSILLIVGSQIRIYFLVWLMGALISVCPTSKYLNKKNILNSLSLLSILILCIALTIERFLPSQQIADFLIGISTAVMIYLLVNNRSQIKQERAYEKFSKALAGCSYTLYLVHMPILSFIRACVIGDRPWEPDILHIFLALNIVIFVFLYAVAIAHFTEAKTDKFRNIIMSWIKNASIPKSGN